MLLGCGGLPTGLVARDERDPMGVQGLPLGHVSYILSEVKPLVFAEESRT